MLVCVDVRRASDTHPEHRLNRCSGGSSSRDSQAQTPCSLFSVPYLHEDPDETWASLQRKMRWTDLHLLFVDYRSPLISLDALERTLKLPGIAAQLNVMDTWGCPPLYYAIRARPEAVEILLRAGANPWLVGKPLVHAADVGADEAISPLVRAGCDVNERDQYGRSALHTAALPPDKAASSLQRYQVALELVRHSGHAIDWELRDEWGDIPLEQAQLSAEEDPMDRNIQATVALYNTHEVPFHALYIPSPDVAAVGGEGNLKCSTSLVNAGIRGDREAVRELISLGAMVNERDDDGYTLLHLVAMGRARDGYKVALELVHHGGYGIDWDAQTVQGDTPLTLAKSRLEQYNCNEARNVLHLFEDRRLPLGERYLFPCVDPAYCRQCSSMECICAEFSMPGSFQCTTSL